MISSNTGTMYHSLSSASFQQMILEGSQELQHQNPAKESRERIPAAGPLRRILTFTDWAPAALGWSKM